MIYILITIFVLNLNFLNGTGGKILANRPLKPSLPKEASFKESDGLETVKMARALPSVLTPSTPKEATFEDAPQACVTAISPTGLEPNTPKVADFSDEKDNDPDPHQLMPVTPKEATFEEII